MPIMHDKQMPRLFLATAKSIAFEKSNRESNDLLSHLSSQVYMQLIHVEIHVLITNANGILMKPLPVI